jgi:hypothetical protein
MPVILVTQEAEVKRIMVQNQLRKYFASPYLDKNPLQK